MMTAADFIVMDADTITIEDIIAIIEDIIAIIKDTTITVETADGCKKSFGCAETEIINLRNIS